MRREDVGDARGEALRVVDVQELVRPVRVRVRAEDAGDEKLRLRNAAAITTKPSAETPNTGAMPTASARREASHTPLACPMKRKVANSATAEPREAGATCVSFVCSVVWNM